MTIDHNSPLPLYYQIKRLLLAKMESGELLPGDIFPTEQMLQDTYAVSRTTVRQALGELEDEGKITRQRGRGTFVAKPKVKHSPEDYPNLADNMAQQGSKPGWRVLSANWVFPSTGILDRLQVAEGEKVFCLERLRLENDSPIGYHMAYVSPAFATLIDEDAFGEGGSLRYLRASPLLESCVANRSIDALAASEHVAGLLSMASGEPLLRVQRDIYTPENKPVEAFIGLYRGDRFQYQINNMRAISGINA